MTEEITKKKDIKICSNCKREVNRFKTSGKLCNNCYGKERMRKFQESIPKIPCKCGCGELIPSINTKGQPAMFKNTHHVRDPRYFVPLVPKRGAEHPRWKGGRVDNGQGYWMIWKPEYYSADKRGYVLEHVYVYETFHKCCMLEWGVVHHKNQDKKANDITNLQGMTRAQHKQIHFPKKDTSDRRCLNCGSSETYYVKSSDYYQWYTFEGGYICSKCKEKTRIRDRSKKS
jgi:hypothetical protein